MRNDKSRTAVEFLAAFVEGLVPFPVSAREFVPMDGGAIPAAEPLHTLDSVPTRGLHTAPADRPTAGRRGPAPPTSGRRPFPDREAWAQRPPAPPPATLGDPVDTRPVDTRPDDHAAPQALASVSRLLSFGTGDAAGPAPLQPKASH
jgi:hypothetical protein